MSTYNNPIESFPPSIVRSSSNPIILLPFLATKLVESSLQTSIYIVSPNAGVESRVTVVVAAFVNIYL